MEMTALDNEKFSLAENEGLCQLIHHLYEVVSSFTIYTRSQSAGLWNFYNLLLYQVYRSTFPQNKKQLNIILLICASVSNEKC